MYQRYIYFFFVTIKLNLKDGPTLNQSTQRLTWMEGFDDLCKHPYNNFLFSKVDLINAVATPIACISQNVTVHMDEWYQIRISYYM